jgi:radical SAM protein with 4Fe4S-binding SPASM domain
MSYQRHMRGYEEPRTLYQIRSIAAWEQGAYFPPVMVEISPNHACNQKCRFCYTHGRGDVKDVLRPDILVDAFRQVADAGVKSVLVQGSGEPLINKSVPDGIIMGAEKGLSIGMVTNGVLLKEPVQEKILPHMHFIRFSVLDHDPKRYAYLHDCPESHWHTLVKNIEGVVERRAKQDFQYGLWSTIYLDSGNFRDAYNVVKFYKDLGLDYVMVAEATYTEFSPSGRGTYASDELPAEEVQAIKDKVLSLNDPDFRVKAEFPINSDHYNVGVDQSSWQNEHCHGTQFYTIISADGEVYPCWRFWGKKQYSYGSLYRESFEEIWKGDRRKEVEAYLNSTPPCGDECKVCNLTKINNTLHAMKQADSKWKDFLM